MQKLIIKDFGPIRKLDLDIKDLSLFIGEQATGKSTIAKLIYFFKKIVKDELIAYLYAFREVPEDKKNHWIGFQFRRDVRFAFLKVFNNTNDFFTIDYNFKEKRWLHIEHSSERPIPVSIYYTEERFIGQENDINNFELWDEFERICKQIYKYRNKYLRGEMGVTEFEKEEKRGKIIKAINIFFGDNNGTELIYIPASRSLFTVFSERLPSKGWDVPTEDFWKKITDLKPLFRQSFSEIIEQKKLRGNGMATDRVLDLAISKIKEILKGEYRLDKDGEKIYFDKKEYVKISSASSGQQEALWILMQLFILILNKEKVFLIIEEPEAHLFPKAQKSLVELIALLFNEKNSQVFITTHSPYILTAFNNLIYAGNIGQKQGEVDKVISEMLWIEAKNVGAFKLKNGLAEDLIDAETNLIKVEEIDTVSQNINQDFDALLNIELQ